MQTINFTLVTFRSSISHKPVSGNSKYKSNYETMFVYTIPI